MPRVGRFDQAGASDRRRGRGLPMTRPCVLLTGAEGFTGGHLARRLLADGYRVVGFVKPDAGQGPPVPGIAARAVDLRDRAATAEAIRETRPDRVIHLAGIASPAHGDVDAFYATNLLGTRNLLAALADQAERPRAVILASSANVYDPALSGQIDEDSRLAPINDYGVSKLAMEYLRGVFGAALPIVIVRPFNYTGPGQSDRFVIPKIVGALREGRERVELGNIDVSRDWSDVRFVADCYARLLECEHAIGGTFNICSGRAISLREVIALACQVAGRSIEVDFNPAFARANEIPSLWGSHRRLGEVLGPLQPIPFQSTLEWMFS